MKRQERQALAQAKRDEWPADEAARRDEVLAGGIVLAHLAKELRLIGWAEREGRLFCIDRTTNWGNPYPLGPDGDRVTVSGSYRLYFARKYSLHKQAALRGVVLACWCPPETCHGEAEGGGSPDLDPPRVVGRERRGGLRHRDPCE